MALACDDLRARLAHAAVTSNDGPLAGQDPAAIRFKGQHLVADHASEPISDAVRRITAGALEAYAENVPHGAPPGAMGKLYSGQNPILRGQKRKDVTAFAYGAQFVEVRVHRRTCEIRVPRMVWAFAAGTIVNLTAAHSQYKGGMIWGLSSALLEETEIDLRAARYVNDNLSEYLIPVAADVRQVEVIMVPEADDKVNPMGPNRGPSLSHAGAATPVEDPTRTPVSTIPKVAISVLKRLCADLAPNLAAAVFVVVHVGAQGRNRSGARRHELAAPTRRDGQPRLPSRPLLGQHRA